MKKEEFAALPEEKQIGLVATALFCRRGDGRIEEISSAEAAQLLGYIGSYATGQGGFNLLIPVHKIQELNLSESLWQRAAKSIQYEEQAMYDLDNMTGCELIRRLEVLSGKSWDEMRTLKETTHASRGDRHIA